MRHPYLYPLASLLAFLTTSAPSHADGLNLEVSIASLHTEAWAQKSLNQHNPGAGLAWAPSRNWTFTTGFYTNSYRRTSVYALSEWTPIHLGISGNAKGSRGWALEVGAAAGFVSGYRHSEVPCAPVMGGVVVRLTTPAGMYAKLIGVPNTASRQSGFIGLQLGVPL